MASTPPAWTRIFFVDFLRATIVTPVIVHHASIVYAANTPFYYVETTTNVLAVIVLVLFQLLNQAWFMGLFFLVSGYFTPTSLDREGPVRNLYPVPPRPPWRGRVSWGRDMVIRALCALGLDVCRRGKHDPRRVLPPLP